MIGIIQTRTQPIWSFNKWTLNPPTIAMTRSSPSDNKDASSMPPKKHSHYSTVISPLTPSPARNNTGHRCPDRDHQLRSRSHFSRDHFSPRKVPEKCRTRRTCRKIASNRLIKLYQRRCSAAQSKVRCALGGQKTRDPHIARPRMPRRGRRPWS